MNSLRDLLARERRSDALVLRDDGTGREYDAHRLLTNAWKTSNLLHHCGVRAGHTVGVVGRAPEAVLTFLGAVALGAVVRFDPPEENDARAVVAPTPEIGRFDLPAGGSRIAYGDDPDDPGVRYFERDVWSQNPTLAPAEIAAEDDALVTPDASFTHADLLAAAETVIERTGMETGSVVAVRASLAVPGAVAGGLVAPLVAGGTIVFPDDGTVADIAVGTDTVPEETACDPDELF